MSNALTKQANIKSKRHEDFEIYLLETRKRLNQIEWRFENQPLKVDALHIEQFVITECKYKRSIARAYEH